MAQEKMDFTFENVVYPDPALGFQVKLSGGGRVLLETENAVSPTFSAEISDRVANSFRRLGTDIPYDKLPFQQEAIISLVNSDIASTGVKVLSLEFTEFYPDEESVSMIVWKRREQRQNSAPQQTGIQQSDPQPYTQNSGGRLKLLNAGDNKVQVISYIVKKFNKGLADAKRIADNAPSYIAENLSQNELNAHIAALCSIGASVTEE